MKTESTIREALQEANQKIFLPRSIEVKLLNECADAVPTLVEWLYDDWHLYDTTLTRDRLTLGLKAQLAKEGMPFTLVALKDGAPIGMISLKKEGPAELSDFPGPWPGSFHVHPQEKRRRTGWYLAKLILNVAKRLGYKQLFFYTSNPRNVLRYKKLGARVIEVRPFRGHEVTVMKIEND